MKLRILRMESAMSSAGEEGYREGSGAARAVWKASGKRMGAESGRLKKEEWVMKAKTMGGRVTCC